MNWHELWNWNWRLEWLNSHEWSAMNDSLVHLLPASSSKLAPKATAFYAFMCNRALATVSRAFSPPRFPKVLRMWQLCTISCDQLLDDDVVDIWNPAGATVSRAFSQPHLNVTCFFRFLMWNRSLAAVSFKLFPASSSKSAPRPSIFVTCPSRNRAIPTVSCTFCRPHLPKVFPDPQFFNMFKWKSGYRYSLVDILPTTFPGPNRAAQARKQRPSSGDRG